MIYILLQYPKCEKLKLTSDNESLIDINHMKNLLELTACYKGCQLGDDGFKNIYNLTKLIVYYNSNITNINHLKNLIELDASNNCGITNDGIKDLISLQKLNIIYNNKFTNLNHLINLIELRARDNNALNDNSINQGLVNLQNLHLINCYNILNLNHFKKLKFLEISGPNCRINDYGIKDLENLIALNIMLQSIVTSNA